MGLVGYYQRFMKGFSQITRRITSLQRKDVKFHWFEKYESSFQTLKELLTSAPIIKVVNPNKYFVVCIDAFIEGLGGVLMREGNVIFYKSRKLKEHEKNYATHSLELEMVVHTLKF